MVFCIAGTQNMTKDHFVMHRMEDSVFRLSPLRNPKTGLSSFYHIAREEVFEVLKYNEDFRSWFHGNSVSSDGGFYVCSKVDPIFLILPALEQNSQMYTPYEHLLIDNEFPCFSALEPVILHSQLEKVVDHKILDTMKVYRFNEEKTLEWLCKKVANLNSSLKLHGQFNKSISSDEASIARLSWSIISEYLSTPLSQKLKSFLKVPDIVTKVDEEDTTAIIKRSCTHEPKEDYLNAVNFSTEKPNKKVTNSRLTSSQKKLKQASESCKSLRSFFSTK